MLDIDTHITDQKIADAELKKTMKDKPRVSSSSQVITTQAARWSSAMSPLGYVYYSKN